MKHSVELVGKSALLGTSILGLVGALAPAAMAQTDNDEIIVTATKRAQTLQETPIAVNVTTDVEIEQAAISDLIDLQTVSPSLRVRQTSRTANTNFTIRGFGNGGTSAVGIFVDGVYRTGSASAIQDLPRLERVEVLSGPQSTLFGKNASAGVISIVTKKPSHETNGRVEATYGKYNQMKLKGHIGGALSENLAATVSASIHKRDGYSKSVTGFRDTNDRNRWSIRGDVLFEPAENVNFRLIGDYSEIDEDCCTVENIVNAPGPTAIIQSLGGVILEPNTFAYETNYNRESLNKINEGGISLHADIDLGGFTLTSISAYRDNSTGPNSWDLDYSNLDIGSGFDTTTDTETLSQEFRLTSTTQGAIDWMAGLYLFDQSAEGNGTTLYGEDLRSYVFALTGGAASPLNFLEAVTGNVGRFYEAGTQVTKSYGQENQAYSLFGTVDYHLNDALTLSGGLSYTNDHKEVEIEVVQNQDVFGQLDLANVLGGAFAPFGALQFRPPQLGLPNPVESNESRDKEVTYMARAAYDVSDTFNVYGSIGTGFRPTSWATGDGSNPLRSDRAALEAAGIALPGQRFGARLSEAEYATVYELGLKAKFDKGYLNVALFDQNIKDFQTTIFDGVNFISTNAGKFSAKGVEFDLNYAPVENLALSFAGTYLDPVYDEYVGARGAVGGPAVVDRSGTKPGGIHPFSGTVSAVYMHDFANGMDGYIRGEYFFESKADLSDSFPDLKRSVNTINASAGLNVTDNFSAQLWARNLNNDQYWNGAFAGVAQAGTVSSFLSEPQTYGITLAYGFGG